MTIARHYIDALKELESDLEKIAQDAIRDNMDFIMVLLKEKQLAIGIKSDGSPAPNYSPRTIEFAELDNPRTGVQSKSSSERFNYEWSGSWIDSLYIKLENDGFDILARDNKTALLEEISGGKITALTKEHNDIVNKEVIIPAIILEMESKLLK